MGKINLNTKEDESFGKQSLTKLEIEKAWVEAKEGYLYLHRLCYNCFKRGYLNPSQHVAHIEKPKDQETFWNKKNWQTLCEPCFERLTCGVEPQLYPPIQQTKNLDKVK